MDRAGWPVDLPRARLELELGRRRHRRITGPAGLLLFVCLFLPAVKGCNEPVYPLEMPMFWHPYGYGLVFALGAASLTVRGMRATAIALRVLAWLTVAGACVLAIASPGLGIVELALGLILLAVIGTKGHSERRIAATAIVLAAVSVLWFGLWASTAGALIGVYLTLVASIFLLAGALLWLGEI
jgi:hypothetical protein